MSENTAMSVAGETAPLLGTERPYQSAINNESLSGQKPGAPATAAPVVVRNSLPQAIAHRGYSALAPENSILAFQKAVEAGAHAIETDLHLTKDGVVVLSHDKSLKRCFGLDSNIADQTWEEISQLTTTLEPHVPMARLVDLLEYLLEPGREHIWIMFDIKTDDDPETLMRAMAETVASVVPSEKQRPWSQRILLCCWSAKYIRLAQKYFAGFRVAHLTWSPAYSWPLMRAIPDLAFSVQRHALASPFGWLWMKHLRRDNESGKGDHPVYVWTVNEENWMEWSIQQRLDGVITDDPRLFLEVCKRFDDGGDDTAAAAGQVLTSSSSPRGALRSAPRWRPRRTSRRAPLRGIKAYAELLLFVILYMIAMVIWVAKLGLPHRQVQRELYG